MRTHMSLYHIYICIYIYMTHTTTVCICIYAYIYILPPYITYFMFQVYALLGAGGSRMIFPTVEKSLGP